MADLDIKQEEYRVLARKYRPQNFDELIGQDSLVTTLKNAIEGGRIAHAFMLTGIRGTGKTTTARIIAKALNYTGADGTAGPTTGDTSDCTTCQAIAEDRHPDVMEMDAASRTGIDDIREILDGVRYAPTSARYKIYIIDEIHMLSKQAFNALLKTLEEPPSHVKFIFATTEIRKVPVTILSRCQRFDLRRIEVPTLKDHFANICKMESVEAEDEALNLIAQAADGSVRDGLSILDQAMSLGDSGKVSESDVAIMLGATDRVKILDIIDHVLHGKPAEAISTCHDLYRMGTDPRVVIQDMMDMVHGLSILAMNADAGIDALPHSAMEKARTMAASLTTPQLQKAWQVLLKGLGELQNAPNPQKAAEMIILRLTYAADLPDPADLLKKIKDGKLTVTPQSHADSGAGGDNNAPQLKAVAGGSPIAMAQPQSLDNPDSLESMIKLFEDNGEIMLATHLRQDIACTEFTVGTIVFKPYDTAPDNLAWNIKKCLNQWLGMQWDVRTVRDANGAESLADMKRASQEAAQNEIRQTPNIKDVFETFPDAKIIRVFNKEEEDS